MKVKVNIEIKPMVILTVTEGEARALSAIMAYGPESFIKGFYKNMGKTYLMPHENHVHSLFRSVKKELLPALGKIDKANAAINN